MAYLQMMRNLDCFQLIIVLVLMLIAIGYVACVRFKMIFSGPRGNHPFATVTKGASECLPEAFVRYRSAQVRLNDTVRTHDDIDRFLDDRRTDCRHKLDDGFQEDLNSVIQRVSRLTLDEGRYFRYDKDVFQVDMDDLAVRLGGLSLAEKKEVGLCPWEEVVIDERCVPDRRKQKERQRMRRMLRERETSVVMKVQNASEEKRWARAEVMEKQRLLKARDDWEKKEILMRMSPIGQELLHCRRERSKKRDFRCLRILLMKSHSGDPWMVPYLQMFNE